MSPIRLQKMYHNKRTKPKWFEGLWMVAEALFVSNPLQISSRLRVIVLTLFGAKIGHGTIIRDIHVKWPWNLSIGDRCWIGERVWFHNQNIITVLSDTVISQETFLTTGSHNIRGCMELITKPITIGSGVWITTRCVVQMGVTIGDNTVITPNSVIHKSMPADAIYGGNPATYIRDRNPIGVH